MACRPASALLAALLAGCASLPPLAPRHAACRADFLGHDARAAEAEARDGGAHRIEGFPYLRSDRFLASFAGEVGDPARFAAWIGRLRPLDLSAREAELRNTGWSDPAEELAHLDRCGAAWAEDDLADPRRRAQLRERAVVPDDYSGARRALGLYPLTQVFLRSGVRGYQQDVRSGYAVPEARLGAGRPLQLWMQRAGSVPMRDGPAPRDALGIPQLTEADWRALASLHAPAWLVERGGEADRPGAVVLRDEVPAVVADRPVTYFHGAFTRFRGEVLPQLVYTVWFGERPAEGRIDSYAGALDAVVWRVTLDPKGEPLLYDTIHACGCYHYVFPAQPLRLRAQESGQEMPLAPQPVLPRGPFAIRLESGTHYVQRLAPLPAATPARYELRPYPELLSLPAPGDGPRSLFGEDGIAGGTERGERWWLWPSGIRSPGAMRQWGRHATAFVGRRHFDDAFLLEELFEGARERAGSAP